MPDLLPNIQKRFESFVTSLPKDMRKAIHPYLLRYRNKFIIKGKYNNKNMAAPYWVYLPWVLRNHYRKSYKITKIASQTIHDIIWGQFCMFLFIRIQDDIFDRQMEKPTLIYVADQFIIEAFRVYLSLFDSGSDFWKYFNSYLRETSRAIIDSDTAQKSLKTSCVKLLDCYVRVNSIFKIGIIATCSIYNRMDHVPSLINCIENLSKVGQILDDLDDMNEDFDNGRFNYVSLMLSKSNNLTQLDKNEQLELLLKQLLITNSVDKIFKTIINFLLKARKSVESIELQQGIKYIQNYIWHVEQWKIHLHHQRVKLFFPDLIKT